jgi:DNA invertase Pin-like site-specific DNA recombinase
MKTVRCAIYTRKSSDEGLEQAFNSLDAQREACAAYVLSQASEGWSALPDVYDDGGMSGGSLERPALQRLLSDVAAGRINIIVVYKVDRLTRSLLDFAKLVEAFDKANTSFVSVTQSFNTTTSMGRLTLNMLLSFAQFEREVTAERIRDKITASKAKGMWMGGTPPLGYKPAGRSLSIVDEHAVLIRDIYRRYLELGNVRLVADQLAREGLRSPVRETLAGREYGGGAFARGQLYAILKNPIYVGAVAHRGQMHAGQHPAIIERATWDLVQARLADHLKGDRRARRAASPSVLAGLIVDEAGEALVAAHACKGKTRYRYYVSRALQHRISGDASEGIRIPAKEIEAAVAGQIAEAFRDPMKIAEEACLRIDSGNVHLAIARSSAAAEAITAGDHDLLGRLVTQVRIRRESVQIDLSSRIVADLLGVESAPDAPSSISVVAAIWLTRTGRAVRLVQANGCAPQSMPNPTLVRLIFKAREWWGVLSLGEVDIKTLAAAKGVTASYMTRVVRLAFVAPGIVDSIVEGCHPAALDGSSLTAPAALPLGWADQCRALLPTA